MITCNVITLILYISGSNTSYTGNGASRLERSALREVEQGMYPQESATSVTPAVTVLVTTPQSGGLVTRIGHGSDMEQPQELPARQMDQVNASTMQSTERTARIAHSARKRKKLHTEAEQIYNRSRYTESAQTTPEIQASWETYSHSTTIHQPSRPIMESKRIQRQGQPRDWTLMTHGDGSTRYFNDVPDMGKMAASLQ
jgi:hypothetical protein